LKIDSIEELQSLLREKLYVADRGLATSIYLALKLERPLFVEGEAGVGKTEIAKVLADILSTELIRLQCYEGIDASQAVYEWSYTRQMMHIRLAESRKEKLEDKELFGPEFLLERPLLTAIDPKVDRSGCFSSTRSTGAMRSSRRSFSSSFRTSRSPFRRSGPSRRRGSRWW
jgi:hypothetical protein